MAATVKDRDLELWKNWKRTQSDRDLQLLLDQLRPIILREVNKWAGGMSRSLLEAEGKRLTVEAIKAYDPKQGAALSTFVAGRLPKLSRLVYSTQSSARLPETKVLYFNAYNTAKTELQDLHGRDPTSDELSDRLGWSKKKLSTFQRQALRKEFVESEEHADAEEAEDHLVDYIYHDLTPLQKQIFEHSTGYLGKSKLSGAQMQKKLSITQGQLSYQKALIVSAVERARARTYGR